MSRRTTVLDEVTLVGLSWGPMEDRSVPLAVLLHGFPDTAHTWRHLGPALAGAGYRVLAPFTRGYAPSGVPGDGSYHVPALMHDALGLHRAHGGDERAVLVGHDWGAITANGIAASAANPFRTIVALAVPPFTAMNPRRDDVLGWLRILPRQAAMSWYTLFNQLPAMPERTFERLVARLWRTWSPGYDATEDLALLAESLPDRDRRAAAVGYYRAQPRRWRLPAGYRELAGDVFAAPRVPLLYLHGAEDGCLDVRWARRIGDALPPGSRVEVVEGAGHFLQLERPAAVNERILDFVAASAGASPPGGY
ncbi:alpha/beta hydrolase [Nocardioides sp. zg-536]|uniref:Alpha/beta hydrolase n=1 Tax=Nocardioides faecalis TaxID=2803858 RepID=A0A939BWV4_9ACTN|nr:alpha/beta hydrolase [Nocardioides faecalis]MBM9461456.1 alpha/beta hydrolase [Nocardioides faecalis]QVI59356.1 alpha/beta hydrolase [Nocardioides faecalis]